MDESSQEESQVSGLSRSQKSIMSLVDVVCTNINLLLLKSASLKVAGFGSCCPCQKITSIFQCTLTRNYVP